MKFLRVLCVSIVLALAPANIIGCGLFDQGVQKYDTLVDKDEKCDQKWSDYESNLQRRSEMIPQLVSVVKGSAAHEQDTLTAVIQARASATRPEIKLDAANNDFTDPAKVAAFQAAQAQLGTAIGKLMMVQEKYPDLKANQAFHDLQVQIEGTENRLLRAREEYNKSVQDYNTELRHVSGKVINPITHNEFKPRVYFKMDPGAAVVPTIDFSKAPVPSASTK